MRARIEAMLEAGPSRFLVPLATAWGNRVRLRHQAPMHSSILCVGGATLGGSYKTPLAIACATALQRRGMRVAYVGHGYASKVSAPRVVTFLDSASTVGDEACLARHALHADIAVVVARSRTQALAKASTLADLLVVDGVHDVVGGARVLRLLVVDASEPWGAGYCFPAGNLRAPKSRLLEAADAVVAVTPVTSATSATNAQNESPVAGIRAPTFSVTREAVVDSGVPQRVGLYTALARPDRVLADLSRLGIRPAVVVRCPDHRAGVGVSKARILAKQERLDGWLLTGKCKASLESADLGAKLWDIGLKLTLPEPLFQRLDASFTLT